MPDGNSFRNITRSVACFISFGYQVVAVQEEANRLQGSYAGDKAKEIQAKEDEVLDAWKRLNWRVKQRTERLHDADDLYRFLLAVQDQMLWMNDMLKQILTYEKAKLVIRLSTSFFVDTNTVKRER